jgi:pantothenate synthetase
VALVGADDLSPVQRVEDGALLAIAARVGTTRLIDNAILEPEAGS